MDTITKLLKTLFDGNLENKIPGDKYKKCFIVDGIEIPFGEIYDKRRDYNYKKHYKIKTKDLMFWLMDQKVNHVDKVKPYLDNCKNFPQTLPKDKLPITEYEEFEQFVLRLLRNEPLVDVDGLVTSIEFEPLWEVLFPPDIFTSLTILNFRTVNEFKRFNSKLRIKRDFKRTCAYVNQIKPTDNSSRMVKVIRFYDKPDIEWLKDNVESFWSYFCNLI